jgi:hypothetical protein
MLYPAELRARVSVRLPDLAEEGQQPAGGGPGGRLNVTGENPQSGEIRNWTFSSLIDCLNVAEQAFEASAISGSI